MSEGKPHELSGGEDSPRAPGVLRADEIAAFLSANKTERPDDLKRLIVKTSGMQQMAAAIADQMPIANMFNEMALHQRQQNIARAYITDRHVASVRPCIYWRDFVEAQRLRLDEDPWIDEFRQAVCPTKPTPASEALRGAIARQHFTARDLSALSIQPLSRTLLEGFWADYLQAIAPRPQVTRSDSSLAATPFVSGVVKMPTDGFTNALAKALQGGNWPDEEPDGWPHKRMRYGRKTKYAGYSGHATVMPDREIVQSVEEARAIIARLSETAAQTFYYLCSVFLKDHSPNQEPELKMHRITAARLLQDTGVASHASPRHPRHGAVIVLADAAAVRRRIPPIANARRLTPAE